MVLYQQVVLQLLSKRKWHWKHKYRDKKASIYFLKGHREKNITGDNVLWVPMYLDRRLLFKLLKGCLLHKVYFDILCEIYVSSAAKLQTFSLSFPILAVISLVSVWSSSPSVSVLWSSLESSPSLNCTLSAWTISSSSKLNLDLYSSGLLDLLCLILTGLVLRFSFDSTSLLSKESRFWRRGLDGWFNIRLGNFLCNDGLAVAGSEFPFLLVMGLPGATARLRASNGLPGGKTLADLLPELPVSSFSMSFMMRFNKLPFLLHNGMMNINWWQTGADGAFP